MSERAEGRAGGRGRDAAETGADRLAAPAVRERAKRSRLEAPSEQRPLLRVVRGDPSPEELAALVTAVTATLAGAAEPRAKRVRSAWADPARQVRRPLPHGQGAWRRLGLPS